MNGDLGGTSRDDAAGRGNHAEENGAVGRPQASASGQTPVAQAELHASV